MVDKNSLAAARTPSPCTRGPARCYGSRRSTVNVRRSLSRFGCPAWAPRELIRVKVAGRHSPAADRANGGETSSRDVSRRKALPALQLPAMPQHVANGVFEDHF